MSQLIKILIASALATAAGIAGAQTSQPSTSTDAMGTPPRAAQAVGTASPGMDNSPSSASTTGKASAAPSGMNGTSSTGMTGATAAGTTATGATAASTSTDPYVQKREADSVAKKEYKAKKKAAKSEYKHEKAAAKSDMKSEKRETTAERNAAIATDRPSTPVIPGQQTSLGK